MPSVTLSHFDSIILDLNSHTRDLCCFSFELSRGPHSFAEKKGSPISADPCRQQGERIREEGTRGARGKRKDCHGVLALREGSLTGAVQDESQLQ